MKKQDLIIKRIVDIVNQTAPSSELYLYGSRARGTAKKSSDWDILILLNSAHVSFDVETKFIDNLYEVELETGEIISPLIYSKQDWRTKYLATPLFSNINKEAIRLI